VRWPGKRALGELIRLGDPIGTQALCHILGMRHGPDALRINGLHLFDQAKNLVQMAECAMRFDITDFDSGEVGNAPDLF
jgi:hypothetical protein